MIEIKLSKIQIDKDVNGNFILLRNGCPVLTTSNPEYIHTELKNIASSDLAFNWGKLL